MIHTANNIEEIKYFFKELKHMKSDFGLNVMHDSEIEH